ncbi:MAG: Lrp/AsnC family transcriptional regulator [Methanotrichaceae archaeon]
MLLKLTSKEKIVLYGLARYSGLSDIDLASKIGVDRSTIFKSKRKFREWQLIQRLNVPSGMAIGAEILTVIFAKYEPTATTEMRKKSEYFEQLVNHPNCVFHTSTDTDSVSMIYSRSYTEFKRVFDPAIESYKSKGIAEKIYCYHCPFELTRFSCDSALAVDNTFCLDRTDLHDEKFLEKDDIVKLAKLSEKDKLALYAFVKYPALSDLELSRRTGISRPTISNKRNKFFQRGLLSRQVYINWQKIGCELMSFYHIDVRPRSSHADLMKVYSSFKNIGAALYSYIQPGEIFGAFLSQCYPDLKERMDQEIKYLTQEGLIQGRPQHVIMPLREIKIEKIDYASMVKSMLAVSKEI